MLDKKESQAYIQALFGKQAIHVPINLIVQYQGEMKGQPFEDEIRERLLHCTTDHLVSNQEGQKAFPGCAALHLCRTRGVAGRLAILQESPLSVQVVGQG